MFCRKMARKGIRWVVDIGIDINQNESEQAGSVRSPQRSEIGSRTVTGSREIEWEQSAFPVWATNI